MFGLMNEDDETPQQAIRLEAVFLLYLLGGVNPEDLLRLIEQRVFGVEQLVLPWVVRDDAA